MNITKFFIGLTAAAALFASCAEESNPLDVFEAPVSPYADAEVLAPVTKDINARFDQKYRTVKVTLEDLGLTLDSDAVFYAPYDAETDWCGEDWYSAENGFYMTASGKACQRGADGATFFVEYYPEEARVEIGQIPDVCVVGQTYTLEFGFATVTEKKPVKLNITILEQLPWATSKEHEDGLTYTVYEEQNNDYKALEIPINEQAVMAALGLESLRPLQRAMASDVAYETTMRGINATDGSYDDYNKYTANTGYWYNKSGDVCEWNTEGYGAFVEWDYNVSPMTFRLGQAPSGNQPGDRYDLTVALIYEDKEARLTFKLKIVEEVTDDLGLL